VISSAHIAHILGLGRRVRSANDLRRAVARGLPKRSLGTVVSYVTADAEDAAQLKDDLIPSATYKRRTTTLKPEESERIERLARVMALAEQAFGATADARRFLTTPHPEMGGERPLDVALTELGARQVEEVLWRMEYGLPV
jgi:putative toxin-antitoxin system antitoxin component (TIGR02293 family)